MGHLVKIPGFALEGVEFRPGAADRRIDGISLSDESIVVNETEYLQKVAGVGKFYASDGRYVEYLAEEGADPEWVHLYLNGQVLVALLHQRRIINFHASSFSHEGKGVIVLGDTGAGKTSLTVAFAMNDSRYLSDDLTPVVFRKAVPHIWSFNRKIKLRPDSLGQLSISNERLTEAEAGTGKMYLHPDRKPEEFHQLDVILKIETGEVEEPAFSELSPSEKFTILRSGICSWEILAGMPSTEEAYLQQLVRIIERVHFVRVVRPAGIRIVEMKDAVRNYLESGY